MPSRISDRMTALPEHGPAVTSLQQAIALEKAGKLHDACLELERCIEEAQASGSEPVLAVALRRLAILMHHQDFRERARELVQRSRDTARKINNDLLLAEALNTEGGLELSAGSLDEARDLFLKALEAGRSSRRLRAKVEQNLGIVANIQGRLYEALTRYERSLAAWQAAGDEHGCAIAYHNLGRVSSDRGQAEAAYTYYGESMARAERTGDVYLQAQCLVSQAELDISRQRYENARQLADSALALYGRIGARGAASRAHRVLGMVYRETGRLDLAEPQLRASIELAVGDGSLLNEAESSTEMALLYQMLNRNQEALFLLNTAYRLFRRLDARTAMVNVRTKVGALENTYLTLVRSWGRIIEAADSNAPGHCERVARNALMAARILGLDEPLQTAIMLGAHLHDLGMTRVPRKLLRKAGPLTAQEAELMKNHPHWGVEALGNMELPWDVKPIIRWHHERVDGAGYPDGLRGSEVPVTAQIIGIFDAYDAMTHPRPYQPRLTPEQAITQITIGRQRWSDDVFLAFLRVVEQVSEVEARVS